MKRIALLILSILFLAATFKGDGKWTSGWYQQFFPNMNGSSITSITFLDSLTGFAVTNTNSSLQAYILKTTYGGDNWLINYTYSQSNVNWDFRKLGFVDTNTGFAFGWTEMFKTTNAGLNWSIIINNLYADDIAIINKDTMLSVSSSGLDGGVFRSTDGGVNWQRIWGAGGNGMPRRIYMYDKNLGFFMGGSYMRRTTNGGFNWTIIPGESFSGIQFLDTLTGWKLSGGIKKTTDGGITWLTQQVPPMHYIDYKGISILNKDTIWVSGPMQIINSKVLGAIIKTTNGGTNWGYQFVDTAVGYDGFTYINFIDNKHGWAFPYFTGGISVYDKMVHTNIGGNEITYYTGIRHIPNVVPEKFTLGQNYPNPFNPTTNIPFEIQEQSEVILKVFDVQGREVKELINGRWGSGKYIADFDASQFSSEIYFYRIILTGDNLGKTFIDTKRMLLLNNMKRITLLLL